MPPFVSRKRVRSLSPTESSPSSKRQTTTRRAKQTLFDVADAPNTKSSSVAENKSFLERLDASDDESSVSEIDSDDFEDVPPSKRAKLDAQSQASAAGSDDELDWENAIPEPQRPGNGQHDGSGSGGVAEQRGPDAEIRDIDVSLNDDGSYVEPLVSFTTNSKKGPSKRERQIRVQTHCLHAQSLMWHNTIRNSWSNNEGVKRILVEGLSDGVKREVTRWRKAMGSLTEEELAAEKREIAAKNRRRSGRDGKRSARDWNYEAEHLEQGVPNMSRGDPLLRLLKILAAYWRKRFVVTSPGLRKTGYMPLKRLREEIRSWEAHPENEDEHGERIIDLKDFQQRARTCEGSRDVGAQLFVALLRGLGLETRLVANLQPAGFGWSKTEEANPKRGKTTPSDGPSADAIVKEPSNATKSVESPASRKKAAQVDPRLVPTKSRKGQKGHKARPINLDDSESSLSEPPSDMETADGLEKDVEIDDDDDLSVIDLTPVKPRRLPSKKYDRDLAFPNYWTEVCSPATHKWIPVDPIVLSTIASNEELLQTFEPRGKKAELAKQVICYVIAFAADGTAKDVTVRYLKRHQLPGKTKGLRMPVEKVPVYNKHGKVKRHEEYDWFRTVMSLYDRPESKRTAADDLEDGTDLQPFKANKESKAAEKESLQWYKQSAEFVLEDHLRREEALRPGSQPVKIFTAGKGEKSKEHPVFRRSDVVLCKTVESWHKEGREIRLGEQPVKYVPVRAVTLTRKREMEDAQRETGEKLKQGLYGRDQTDWIIPPPIVDGVIPKNAFGNMDVYVPTMVPAGAVHLPLRGSAKLCRKLGIDYAEACTGFEFGKQRAVPVLTGVVVAEDNVRAVRDAWRAEQQELRRKEDMKRTALALHWWRKMVMGMRIIERMRADYQQSGGREEELNPFVNRSKREKPDHDGHESKVVLDDEMGGGFFPPGYDDSDAIQDRPQTTPAAFGDEPDDQEGGFLLDNEAGSDAGGGGFLIGDEDDEQTAALPAAPSQPIAPRSLQSMMYQEDMSDLSSASKSESTSTRIRKPAASTKTTSTLQRQAAKKPAATRTSVGRSKKTINNIESEASEASFISDLPDPVSASESDRPTKHASAHSTPRLERRTGGSPRVVIPSTRNSRSATARKPRAPRVKSRYFEKSDDDDNDLDNKNISAENEDETDLEENSESEAEIIVPRKTTARTRRAGR